MLTNEEIFVYKMVLKSDIDEKLLLNLNIEAVIRILVEHKIFLRYYKTLLELFNGKNSKSIQLQYILLKERKIKYKNFFKKLIDVLNENHIDFVIYKGIILETIINSERMYSDIDLVLKNCEDYKKVIDILAKNFSIIDINTNFENDLVLEDYVIIDFENFNYSIEFKKENNNNIIKNYSDMLEININNSIISTFSLEVTFLNLINYVYNFTNNYFYIQNGNRFILQYFDDLKIFIEKYCTILNLEKIKVIATENKMLKKISKCFKLLKQIYNFDFTQLFAGNYIFVDEEENSLFDSIPILFKIFRREEAKNLYLKFIHPSEILKGTSKVCKEHYLNLIGENVKLSCDKPDENNLLIKVSFENSSIDKIIYLQLYYFDNYGFFVNPFMPIFVFNYNGKFIAKKFFHSRTSKIIDLTKLNMLKTFSDEIVKITEKSNEIIININLYGLQVNCNYKMGLNCIVYNYKNSLIYGAATMNNIDKYPLILNR